MVPDPRLDTLLAAIDPRNALKGDITAIVALAEAHRQDSELVDRSDTLLEGLKTDTCNLMVIRRIVDKAIAEWALKAAGPIPNGYAGEIAAALWVHLQTRLTSLSRGEHAEGQEQELTRVDRKRRAAGPTGSTASANEAIPT